MILTPRGLLVYGPKMIHTESQDVEVEDWESLPMLREYMLNKMAEYHGIGIAAPQVGSFKNFFLMVTQQGQLIDMVNPEILQMYGHEVEGFEACLSIPPVGNGCPVARLQTVRVCYGTTETPNTRRTAEFSGMDAIVIQHEMDHLTGTFFVDRVSQSRKKDVLELFEKWKATQTVMQVNKERRDAKNFA